MGGELTQAPLPTVRPPGTPAPQIQQAGVQPRPLPRGPLPMDHSYSCDHGYVTCDHGYPVCGRSCSR